MNNVCLLNELTLVMTCYEYTTFVFICALGSFMSWNDSRSLLWFDW